MSVSKNTIKLINSLRSKKFRQKYNIFVAEGSKICKEVLLSNNFYISKIYATKAWIQDNSLPIPYDVEINEITPLEMKKISNLKTESPVLMLLKMELDSVNSPRFDIGYHLYLDDVQDPGNVGTLIRSAEWFGCQSVIRSPGSADFYSPKVVQATMGAFAHLPLHTLTQAEAVDLKIPILVTKMDGESIHTASLPTSGLITISNEGSGLSDLMEVSATIQVTIPKATSSRTESLNAGLAGGILLSHLLSAKPQK